MPFEVPFIRPTFPDSARIASDFDEILASNWFTNFGPMEQRFAARIAEFVGEDVEAVTVANATLGLMALVHTRLGPGDGSRSVVVPSFTFAAGPEAIEWCGYRPAFIDIEPGTLQPSLKEAQAAVERLDVAGVLLCNSFGIGNPDIARWDSWAKAADLPLLVDSAAGFGSAYPEGRRLGGAGTAEVFSFHATKPFAIGEGGAVVTRDRGLAQKLRAFQNFGFGGDRRVGSLGLNAKLPELSAAIGLRQFEGFESRVQKRQRALARYVSGLKPGWTTPGGSQLSSVCFATVIAPHASARENAMRALADAGVEARRYYHPVVTDQPHFAAARRVGELPVTRDIASRVISLPVHDDMPDSLIDRISSIVSGSGS